jgi:ABC-type transport system substrate-binding protein
MTSVMTRRSALEIDIVMSGSAEGVVAAQICQSDLAKIGVKLNVQDLAAAAWADQVNNHK